MIIIIIISIIGINCWYITDLTAIFLVFSRLFMNCALILHLAVISSQYLKVKVQQVLFQMHLHQKQTDKTVMETEACLL